MTEDVIVEESKLDPFFYFKRGYSQYGTYVLGLIGTAGVLLLDLKVLLSLSNHDAAIVLTAIGIPSILLMIRIGIWDMYHGGKKIEMRMHYGADEVWLAQMMAIYTLLKEDYPEQAAEYRKVMLRYQLVEEAPDGTLKPKHYKGKTPK